MEAPQPSNGSFAPASADESALVGMLQTDNNKRKLTETLGCRARVAAVGAGEKHLLAEVFSRDVVEISVDSRARCEKR